MTPSSCGANVARMSTPIRSIAQDQTGVESTLHRIQRDFLEMPGLRLTSRQAQRLWGLDALICDALLRALVDVRFLVEADGIYICNGATRFHDARADTPRSA
jgi:hypothetical protein